MRYLTIQRKKSFVACLMPMKVYIESPEFGDTKINGVMCVKLGNLKNGETQTFQIPDNQAKVFVIADKLSKGYCNDFFEIPAGNQNIFLSGKNNFNPATGNAFRFDYNNSPEAKAHRKKGVAKGIIVLIICLIIGVVVGVASALLDFSSPSPQEFSYGDMSITLTDDFYEVTDYDAFSICYDSADVAVFVTEDKFADYDGLEDYTIEEYAEAMVNFDDYTLSYVADGSEAFFEYDYNSDGTTYHYKTYICKEDAAFWIIQFAAEADYYSENEAVIDGWADSVKFDSPAV